MLNLHKFVRSAFVWLTVLGLVLVVLPASAPAALSFNLEPVSGWPNQAHYNAAVAAMQATVDRYNAYSPTGFGNYNAYVYYEAGIPTAQASYAGSIGFGGTYPGERVAMHEMAHYLGLPSGGWNGLMTGGTWDGANGLAIVQQFDGLQATLNGDGVHFWPYGLNFDSEGSEINRQRQVAVVYAMRADLGIGPSSHPSNFGRVALTASDPVGQSGFNYKDRWSDGYFAHSNASYSTGDYLMRTPASPNSFKFAGKSLTLNNTNGSAGGLAYVGSGTTGIITVDPLYLQGGWIQHLGGSSDKLQLDGTVNVTADSTIAGTQGSIDILADLTGSSKLTIGPVNNASDRSRFVRLLSDNNSFTGDIINEGRFQLAPGANFTFDVGPSGVNNVISGPLALSTMINGTFEFDLSEASSTPGDSWALVTANNASFGVTFSVAGFTNDGGVWTDGTYAFDQATGILSVPASSNVDMDGDGDVDGADFLLIQRTDPSLIPAWQSQYGTPAEPSFATTVPEPASLVLLFTGLISYLVRRCH